MLSFNFRNEAKQRKLGQRPVRHREGLVGRAGASARLQGGPRDPGCGLRRSTAVGLGLGVPQSRWPPAPRPACSRPGIPHPPPTTRSPAPQNSPGCHAWPVQPMTKKSPAAGEQGAHLPASGGQARRPASGTLPGCALGLPGRKYLVPFSSGCPRAQQFDALKKKSKKEWIKREVNYSNNAFQSSHCSNAKPVVSNDWSLSYTYFHFRYLKRGGFVFVLRISS